MSPDSLDNDVYDFTELRENEMQIYSGMNMDQLLNYAFCVSPEGDVDRRTHYYEEEREEF